MVPIPFRYPPTSSWPMLAMNWNPQPSFHRNLMMQPMMANNSSPNLACYSTTNENTSTCTPFDDEIEKPL